MSMMIPAEHGRKGNKKQGHWISTGTGEDEYYECSECGYLFIILEGTPEENEMFYCPRCGARLDGKADL